MGLSRWEKAIEAQDLATFGAELGPVYSALSSDVLWLHSKWREYEQLYAGSVSRIKVLNDTAPLFFSMLKHVLRRDVLLHIARLTDLPTQGNRENLTLLSLPPLLASPFRNEVEAMLKSACKKAAFARAYRNKYLAHNDLRHALDRVESLAMGSGQNVEVVLESFASVLNAISSHYGGGMMLYRDPSSLGDADSLVFWLNLAQVAEAKRRARVEAGDFAPEDLEYPSAP